MNRFFEDVYKGLSAPVKKLDSKYFYDKAGDDLFGKIMECPEYYLTNCELEILSTQSRHIIDAISTYHNEFDVVELGAGNALKSRFLLKALVQQEIAFTYYPIDISGNVIQHLEKELPVGLPGLLMQPFHGEYLEMLNKVAKVSKRNKLVLFLGANIGNLGIKEAAQFCSEIRELLSPGDMMLIGFDLTKNPRIVLDAYNDKAGITKQFNINLLHRINRELDANFITTQFDHFPVYDPQTGTCKSYLVSLADQVIRIGEAHFIYLKEGESVLTEISQKYTIGQVEEIAHACGFTLLNNYYDSRKWFTDSLWILQ